MTAAKNHGYHLQIAWLRWTSSRRSISLYPSENGRCSQIIENSKIGMSRHLDSSTTTQMAKIMVQYGRPSWTKSVWSSSGRTIMGKAIWENPFEILLGEGSQLGMLIRTSWKGLFLSVYVDDIKLAGKKQNIDPMWKVLNKEVDLGEPTSFLDHVLLGCTQRQCEISKDIVDNYRTMFESRISAVWTEKLPFPQNLRISSWSYDMEGHAKKCVERYCELANKTTQQLYKVSTPCIDDHHFKEEEMKSVGELSHVCSQIDLKCLHLAQIGRPDILWSVNKLARSITKWTKACDKRLNRLIYYIHHTREYKQYCYVENTAKQCRLGTVSRLRFCVRSWGFKIYIRWNIMRFRKSYSCSNKLDVQEANISFTQFNRMRNHPLGCRIEIGRDSRTWYVGSDRRSSWKHESEP